MSVPRTLKDGRYSITRILGSGGMAEVHECYDHGLNVWRAAKFLLAEHAERRGLRRRFESEAQAMARVEHRNVVRIYDIGEEDGRPFMVMELARGGSLEAWITRYGKMPPQMAVDVVLEACAGVAAAHADGIIHRDLKPDNVLIDRNGVCKVTDFGIAQINNSISRTRTGSVMGTLGFMAPEQHRDAKAVSESADVYSLGATLWSLVTGELPVDLFMAHHKERLLNGVPEALRPVILGACTFDVEDRYPTVAAFSAALAAARPSLPATPAGTPSLVVNKTDVPDSIPIRGEERPSQSVAETLPPKDSGPTLYPGPAEEEEPPKPLPYTMSKQAIGDFEPDYLDEGADDRERRKREALQELARLRGRATGNDSAPPPSIPPSDALTPATPAPVRESADVAAAPAESEAAGQVLDAASGAAMSTANNVASEAVRLLLKFILGPLKPMIIPIIVVILLVAGVLVWAAYDLREAAREANEARNALFETLEKEDRIIDDLREIGAQYQIPEIELSNVRKNEVDREKLEATSRYVSALHEQMNRFGSAAPLHAEYRAAMAAKRLRQIDAAAEHYYEKMLAWEELADESTGRTVCLIRLAPCPD